MQGDIVYIGVFVYLFDMHLSKIKFCPANVYKDMINCLGFWY